MVEISGTREVTVNQPFSRYDDRITMSVKGSYPHLPQVCRNNHVGGSRLSASCDTNAGGYFAQKASYGRQEVLLRKGRNRRDTGDAIDETLVMCLIFLLSLS